MITVKNTGGARLVKQLAALNLPANRRKAWHGKMGRAVIRAAKKNIKQQRQVNGQKFAPGKDGQKLLKRMARGKNLKVYAGANKATVTWPNSLTGKIARAHQEGQKEQYNGARMEKERGQPDYDAPATQDQAKALIKAGYKLNKGKYKSGKNKGNTKSRRVSQSWIKENMTLGQAGLILRMLRDEPGKASWTTEIPAREFFGLNGREANTLGNDFLNDILKGVKSAR